MGPQSGMLYAGSATLQSMWIPSTITLSKDAGAPFELTSADRTKYWNGVQNNQVTFVGFKANGGTVSKTISLNEFILRTHNFASSGFTNLTKVEWTVYGNGSSSHQIDNIRLKVQ